MGAARHPPQVTSEYYRWHLELWRRAEEFGFEGIFFSEHHFGLGYSPSPNLLIARTAAVTRTLRLGVMGVVLPYYEPWRVVEEIGMLDQISGGRIEIGTASGIPQEMAQIGLTVEEANARAAEAIEILEPRSSSRSSRITAGSGTSTICASSRVRCSSRIRRNG